ncbi:hypothetical protein L249_7553 [Ophiocordyceps polyrhachis-furcata BCC 54312]|uniref:Kynurenine formamidase n=1 Tax=Ophiocordyceps polyrhachis-furcata BCC 54312 TaxID=1330021 RepID=A0A367LBN6_9HYPO|nr:hypothetical protein L249_7553 [Ophiocordyceps polyrhachis-furcata BCC 54312]
MKTRLFPTRLLLLLLLLLTPSLTEASFQLLSYGPHPRHVVGLWKDDDQASSSSSPWIIYIHGGAWRRQQDSWQDFHPSVNNMISSRLFPPGTTFASIDYRLSPCAYPGANPCPFPIQHPDHIMDVRAALQMLSQQHGLQENSYVLVGHSAGATLSFQLLMGEAALQGQPLIYAPLPIAVIGIAGIYDMSAINDRFRGAYSDFLTMAFGTDLSLWHRASPARFMGSFRHSLPPSGTVLLARSPQDSLVDEPELDTMARKLEADGVAFSVVKTLRGEHNSVWADGDQITALVTSVFPR